MRVALALALLLPAAAAADLEGEVVSGGVGRSSGLFQVFHPVQGLMNVTVHHGTEVDRELSEVRPGAVVSLVVSDLRETYPLQAVASRVTVRKYAPGRWREALGRIERSDLGSGGDLEVSVRTDAGTLIRGKVPPGGHRVLRAGPAVKGSRRVRIGYLDRWPPGETVFHRFEYPPAGP